MTTNREVFLEDPTTSVIPNDGVAKVVEPRTAEEFRALEYELRTFVCDGQYGAGLKLILQTFLSHLDQPTQPAGWVSGFYGSGKSHLVRVLEYLWRDVTLPSGQSSRSLVRNLPTDISDLLVELTNRARQAGGLWSAAGTLGAGAGDSIRLALLGVVFRAAGLPEQYPAARLIIWLKQNGFYEPVLADIGSKGKDFAHELRNMYVSPVLAQTLLTVVPDLGVSANDVRSTLKTQYPPVQDISDDELLATLEDVLRLQSSVPGKLPFTLLVFDELQQFIGEDSQRSINVQNVVEACCTKFGSQLLFVSTGQSALQGPPNLQRLQGRFTTRVELSDADVEKVIREVVLRKKSDKEGELRAVLDAASGEIDRHLQGTAIKSQPGDKQDIVADYPLLPTRRRFWEKVLVAIDRAGTAAQLRTQIRVVHEMSRTVANEPLGVVAPADLIYQQQESHMVPAGVLLPETQAFIKELRDGTPDGVLRSRLCALIFLINELPTVGPAATGVKATAAFLADLLVEDLRADSTPFRQSVPDVLKPLVDNGQLLLVGDEYRLQTPESAEWQQHYSGVLRRLLADETRLIGDRAAELRNAMSGALKGLSLTDGATKTPRDTELHFTAERPAANSGKVPIWIRDEWSATEASVTLEAREAGLDSPLVFVFLPKRDAEDLRQALASYGAASETLEAKGIPATAAGAQARASMDSRKATARHNLDALLKGVIENARVFQGGGNEIVEGSVRSSVQKAAEASLRRLFPDFALADHTGWANVVKKAREGAGDALNYVGHQGDVDQHPVCQRVRTHIGGAGKRGSEVLKHFSSPGLGFGWPKDAVDGALLALIAAGLVRATKNGQPVTLQSIAQSDVPALDFKSEGVVVTARQKLDLRGLCAELGLPGVSNEELPTAVPKLLDMLDQLAAAAGGNAPLPERPSTTHIAELKSLAGNEQLVGVHNERERLKQDHAQWSATKARVAERVPRWDRLQALLRHGGTLPEYQEVANQAASIESERTLLADPDPLTPLALKLAGSLRAALLGARQRMADTQAALQGQLEATAEWQQLAPEVRERILHDAGIAAVEEVSFVDDDALLRAVARTSLADWQNRTDALPSKFDRARQEAIRELEPKVVAVQPKHAIVRTAAEADTYLSELRAEIVGHLDAGNPVSL